MNKLTLTLISISLVSGLFATNAFASDFAANTTAANQNNAVAAQHEKAPMPTANEQNKLGTIAQITASESSFATLVAALDATQLDELLGAEGPYTIFAPSNTAFEALPAGTMARLLEPANMAKLKAILFYHLVEGTVTSADLTGQQVTTETLEGSTLEINPTDYGLTVNNAKIITADIQASNGVIHIIDTVLMPESIQPTAKVARNN